MSESIVVVCLLVAVWAGWRFWCFWRNCALESLGYGRLFPQGSAVALIPRDPRDGSLSRFIGKPLGSAEKVCVNLSIARHYEPVPLLGLSEYLDDQLRFNVGCSATTQNGDIFWVQLDVSLVKDDAALHELVERVRKAGEPIQDAVARNMIPCVVAAFKMIVREFPSREVLDRFNHLGAAISQVMKQEGAFPLAAFKVRHLMALRVTEDEAKPFFREEWDRLSDLLITQGLPVLSRRTVH